MSKKISNDPKKTKNLKSLKNVKRQPKNKKSVKLKKPKSPPKINISNELHSKFLKRVFMYTFFGFLIAIFTVLVFYRTRGYTFNRNGQVVRRGIALIDSAPVSATIFVDGKEEDKTDAKLELDEGKHNLRIVAKGYKTWQKDFEIKSEQVEWFYYPYLIPESLTTQGLQTDIADKTYSKLSSDGRVVALSKNSTDAANQTVSLELLTLKEDDLTKLYKNLIAPSQIFSKKEDGSFGEFRFIEWSPNNDSILLEHVLSPERKELINIRVENPEESLNLTTQLNLPVQSAHYDSRSRIYALINGELKLHNPKSLAVEQSVATSVSSFQNFNDNKYIFTKSIEDGTEVYLQDNQSPPVLITKLKNKDLSSIDYKYIINRRNAYLNITDSTTNEFIVYKNPLDSTKKPPEPLFLATLEELIDSKIYDSPGGSAQPGLYVALRLTNSKVYIYDFEEEDSMSYELKAPASSPDLTDKNAGLPLNLINLSWIDSERLQAKAEDGKIYYFDYDGNYLNLIASSNQDQTYFVESKNKTIFFNSEQQGKNTLNQIKFRLQ